MLELNKVHCGDCLELMKQIPDKSIDLVLTDPPYGIGISGQKKSISKNPKHNRKYHEDFGRDNQTPSQEYFDEIYRISKNQIIRGGNYFIDKLHGNNKGWIVRDKGQHGLTMSDGELARTSYNKPLRIFLENRVAIQVDGSVHPTQKPLSLFRWILENYSEPGMTICDPFLGSGTTAIACKELGRNFIGIEKEPKYVDIANKRLENTTISLF